MERAIRLSVVLMTAAFASTAGAQESGFLLGLELGDSAGSYRTLWIAPERGEVRLLASGHDLIVPRRSGFWRVCVAHESGADEDGAWTEDDVVAGPATPSRDRCSSPNMPVDTSEAKMPRCHNASSTTITFISADAMSREESESSDCGAHPSSGTHSTLTSLASNHPVDLARFLTGSRRAELMRASLTAGRAEFAEFGNVDTVAPDPSDSIPTSYVIVEEQWGVERGPGGWHATGNVTCFPQMTCSNGLTFSIPDFAAPASLVGDDSPSPSLAEVKAAYPGVQDAFSSPRHDLVVALTGDSLLVFVTHNGRLAAPALQVPASGRVVMAQWALGRFVPLWTEQLRNLLPVR